MLEDFGRASWGAVLRPYISLNALNVSYGLVWDGRTFVSVDVKSKRTSHSLGTGWPEIFAGEKSHCFAAFTAASLKKRLGDEAGTAEETAPDLSTRTLTTTRAVPRMVLRALEEMSGIV
jgi:hypothetical protein